MRHKVGGAPSCWAIGNVFILTVGLGGRKISALGLQGSSASADFPADRVSIFNRATRPTGRTQVRSPSRLLEYGDQSLFNSHFLGKEPTDLAVRNSPFVSLS